MKKGLHLVVNNTMKVEISTRDFAALNLCRKTLENCLDEHSDAFTMTGDGEFITLNSAIEVFENVLDKCRKELK